MKIWIVNHYAVPPKQAGGTRHYEMAKELVRRGHDVTIVASSFDHTMRRELHLQRGEHHKLEDVGGVPFLWLRTPPYLGNTAARVRNMLAFGLQVWRRLTHEVVEPDVILGSSPHLFAALAAERLAARYAIPFVFEVRDLWPQTLIDLGHFPRHHPFVVLLDRIERYLYRRAGRIVTLLPRAADHIREKGTDPSKVTWIPNGIDLDLVPTPPPPRRRKMITVMYAGAHGLANDLNLVLDAANMLQQDGWADRVHFRMVGDGPEKSGLIRRAQGLGLVNIDFEAAVPKENVYKRLAEADAFVMVLQNSSLFRWGISPNKLFDYLASARPVIFCVNTSFNPIEETRAGITVVSQDASNLVMAIRKLTEISPEERWHMGLRGRRYVEANHSMSNLASRLEEIMWELTRSQVHSFATAIHGVKPHT